ncbi:hypothetical protein Y032_0064g3493 [Ancylostoma ceylanicum]|uniref:Uncharacterized protein n=1 Tax=Ancylostoma ceylanicum TaxID=53326 RepID=A0A016U077_9BILA|nr:hypothetical protein Y032_0064g3493 [Ancylostoma ceylanicum]
MKHQPIAGARKCFASQHNDPILNIHSPSRVDVAARRSTGVAIVIDAPCTIALNHPCLTQHRSSAKPRRTPHHRWCGAAQQTGGAVGCKDD